MQERRPERNQYHGETKEALGRCGDPIIGGGGITTAVKTHSITMFEKSRILQRNIWYHIGPYSKGCEKMVVRQKIDTEANERSRFQRGLSAETSPRTGGDYILAVGGSTARSFIPIPSSCGDERQKRSCAEQSKNPKTGYGGRAAVKLKLNGEEGFVNRHVSTDEARTAFGEV